MAISALIEFLNIAIVGKVCLNAFSLSSLNTPPPSLYQFSLQKSEGVLFPNSLHETHFAQKKSLEQPTNFKLCCCPQKLANHFN